MSTYTSKVAVVSIPSVRIGQLKSSLLGDGFLPHRSMMSDDGKTSFFGVSDLSDDQLYDLGMIGAELVTRHPNSAIKAG